MKNGLSTFDFKRLEKLPPLVAALAIAGCLDAWSAPVEGMAAKALISDANTYDITDVFLTRRSANCADYVATYRADAINLATRVIYAGFLTISVEGDTCVFTSNAVPNHDFSDRGEFANAFAEQNQTYRITSNPKANSRPTALSLQYDNAIFLNGVKVDVLAAGCFGVLDGRIGCHDVSTPWRYDPMSPQTNFGIDSHNAHTQPDGTYHYHGNPKALFDDSDDSRASPVIGFAADGFPIFGSYFNDNGTIRKAISSYQLKQGARPSGNGHPGGFYDGTFIDDFAYVEGAGDLDECNGMTIEGVYGYYITDSYPHVLGCFRGTPDASFLKTRGTLPSTPAEGSPPSRDGPPPSDGPPPRNNSHPPRRPERPR